MKLKTIKTTRPLYRHGNGLFSSLRLLIRFLIELLIRLSIRFHGHDKTAPHSNVDFESVHFGLNLQWYAPLVTPYDTHVPINSSAVAQWLKYFGQYHLSLQIALTVWD